MLVTSGVRPVIDSTRPLTDAAEGFRAMAEGDVFGKIVFET
jgi:NADPH:quinone reductase-like Zn-dependent oxidoreductase